MDTTNFLLDLIKTKKDPGSAPLVKPDDLNGIQHRVTMFNPELIFHLASAFNEPAIVNYVLDRYNIDPNTPPSETKYDTYIYVLMFDCNDVLDVYIERKLFPENWYAFFLFAQINNDYQAVDHIIENYPNFIKLTADEVRKLQNISLSSTIKKYLNDINMSK